MSERLYRDRKPTIGYLCSYFPGSMLSGLGVRFLPLFDAKNIHTAGIKEELPVNICGYVRYCQKAISGMDVDGIVVTDCCNGMQRLYDYIKEKRPDLFCYMIEMPRQPSEEDYEFYKSTVACLRNEICSYFSLSCPDMLSDEKNGLSEDKKDGLEKGSIYVLGSAISPGTREKLQEYLKPYPVKMNICSSKERDYTSISGFRSSPCARMSFFTQWFEDFADAKGHLLSGLVYVSSQHCDSFLFNYRAVRETCKKYGIAFLSLEEGYRVSGFGQISTRVEAFMESLSFKELKSKASRVQEESREKGPNGIFKQRMRLVRAIIPKLPLESIKKTVMNQVDIFSEKIWDNPDKVVWTNMVMPAEIFYAAGLIPVNTELVAGWMASLGLSRQFISGCEGAGFSSNLCSYHKATIGLIDEGGLPKPRGIAVSSHICDGGACLTNLFTSMYGADAFILNVPFFNNNINFEYVKQQYEELVRWVENYTGKPMEAAKLVEAIEYSNQAREYWIKAFELRKGRPLFPGHLSLRNLFGATFLFGSSLGVDVAKTYYEELLQKTAAEERGLPDKRLKKRILWIHFAPLYSNEIMEYLEKELNCWIVMDITGYIYWAAHDVQRPLESLARRSLSHYYLGAPDGRRELYRSMVREYRIDGIIHFMHNGCRAIPGSSWQVREVAEEYKLAYLELTGDCIDPRGFSEEQMRLRLDAFRETLGRDFIVSGS